LHEASLRRTGAVTDLNPVRTRRRVFTTRDLALKAFIAASNARAGAGALDRAVTAASHIAAARARAPHGPLVSELDHTRARPRTAHLTACATREITVAGARAGQIAVGTAVDLAVTRPRALALETAAHDISPSTFLVFTAGAGERRQPSTDAHADGANVSSEPPRSTRALRVFMVNHGVLSLRQSLVRPRVLRRWAALTLENLGAHGGEAVQYMPRFSTASAMSR
jgi:hypothetical protein